MKFSEKMMKFRKICSTVFFCILILFGIFKFYSESIYQFFLTIHIIIPSIPAVQKDLETIALPMDSNNLKCGVDKGVEDKPFLFFLDITKCYDLMFNISHCRTPQVSENIIICLPALESKFSQFPQICVPRCPNESFFYMKELCKEETFADIKEKLICRSDFNMSSIEGCEQIDRAVTKKYCARWYIPTESGN